MKDERDKIVAIKKRHSGLLQEAGELNTMICTYGCRYRSVADKCEHPRHMMKKYPQHMPTAPLCRAENCPRN